VQPCRLQIDVSTSRATPGSAAAAIRIAIPASGHRVSVRRLEVFGRDGVELTALPSFVRVSASSAEYHVGLVHTAAFAQAFDLNPAYLRLDPWATACLRVPNDPVILRLV
jgi:hypothetical protein